MGDEINQILNNEEIKYIKEKLKGGGVLGVGGRRQLRAEEKIKRIRRSDKMEKEGWTLEEVIKEHKKLEKEKRIRKRGGEEKIIDWWISMSKEEKRYGENNIMKKREEIVDAIRRREKELKEIEENDYITE